LFGVSGREQQQRSRDNVLNATGGELVPALSDCRFGDFKKAGLDRRFGQTLPESAGRFEKLLLANRVTRAVTD
jgi:hypothetical protein